MRVRIALQGVGPHSAGGGIVARRPGRVILPGDRVFFEPGEEYWHGSAPNRFMVPIAMQQHDESGSPVTWDEYVTDEHRHARVLSS